MSRLALIAGIMALAIAWGIPLLGLTGPSFTRHMITHMGVVAIAAPLIGIGLSGTRFDPSRERPALFSPVTASLVDLIVVWAWHAPAARSFAGFSATGAVLEQVSFLAAGLLLWLSCLGNREPARQAAGAFGLLLTSVHMTLLGALLGLSSRPLYGTGEVTCFGVPLSAVQDQQVGGVVMLLVGAAVYLAGGMVLLGQLLVTPGREASR